MAGGAEAALTQGAADLAALKLPRSQGATAIDLGAGFGMHAIPLARLGYQVTALDTSDVLLAQLAELGRGLNIRAVVDDLRKFRKHLQTPAEIILCMGDTLTHLPSLEDIAILSRDVARALAPGGRYVATFRDYTGPADDNARFISVRSDANRILTCCLESKADHMLVHDIVHERSDADWRMRVSSYPKLRVAPESVRRMLEEQGLSAECSSGPRGMVQIVASRL